MARPTVPAPTARRPARFVVVLLALGIVATLAAARWLEPLPPRRITLAVADNGLERELGPAYARELADDGVDVAIRATGGVADNIGLLLDPDSGVDVAFVQGGVVAKPAASGLVMIASLYYEPLWVFTRTDRSPGRMNELRGSRLAIGAQGGGTRLFVTPLLAANGITTANTTLLPLEGAEAVAAVRDGTADAAMLLTGARAPVVQEALRDPALRLMSFERAGAYERRFPYITRLTLPPGAIDFGLGIPENEVSLIGTEAMLAARESIHPAIVNLLLDAAHGIHGQQGAFERAGEFPNIDPVDLPVAEQARHHQKFGPNFLHRYLPFWVATFVERALVILVPLLIIVPPLVNQLPALIRWRVRSRIYRHYGELAVLERDVERREGPLPIADWLSTLDRIEHAAGTIRVPPSFASEVYTLREHVDLVRRTVLAKAAEASGAPGAS